MRKNMGNSFGHFSMFFSAFYSALIRRFPSQVASLGFRRNLQIGRRGCSRPKIIAAAIIIDFILRKKLFEFQNSEFKKKKTRNFCHFFVKIFQVKHSPAQRVILKPELLSSFGAFMSESPAEAINRRTSLS